MSSNLKKLALSAATTAVTSLAAYAVKRLITRLTSKPGEVRAIPTPEQIAERLRLGRMSRKARKAYRATHATAH